MKNDEKKDFPAYPKYSASEDIYSKAEETDLDPEQTNKKKENEITPGILNEKNFSEDLSGSDLDIPGVELDDAQEEIGSEDEENNLYSLGGDNHDD